MGLEVTIWEHFNPTNTRSVFPIDDPQEKNSVLVFRHGELELRTEFHNSCNHIEDSFCQEMVDYCLGILPLVLLQLDHQGGQEKPKVQETWMGPDKYQQLHTKLLYYK